MTLEEAGPLLIRVTIGLLFLISAFMCGKDAAARQAAAADTALVFPRRSELYLCGGIAIMALGGLSVLLGIFPRLGALVLTLFLIPAAMIHFRKASQARALEEAFRAAARPKPNAAARNTVTELGELAVMGNFTSALKNLILMAPTLYLALAGVEPMLIGFGPDGTLQGLLVQSAAN
jgi:uncharacterized membrane protein YphA (DoxX/SURF4 family)